MVGNLQLILNNAVQVVLMNTVSSKILIKYQSEIALDMSYFRWSRIIIPRSPLVSFLVCSIKLDASVSKSPDVLWHCLKIFVFTSTIYCANHGFTLFARMFKFEQAARVLDPQTQTSCCRRGILFLLRMVRHFLVPPRNQQLIDSSAISFRREVVWP